MTAHVSLHPGSGDPVAYVLTAGDGRFISVQLSSVSLFLPGYEAESAAYARRLAATLTAVAVQIEAESAAEPQTEPVAVE